MGVEPRAVGQQELEGHVLAGAAARFVEQRSERRLKVERAATGEPENGASYDRFAHRSQIEDRLRGRIAFRQRSGRAASQRDGS